MIRRTASRAPALLLLLAAASASAEIVHLRDGQKLEGQIVITYEKGLLLRDKEGAPGRYYPYEEVSRISTKDGMLHYLMPRGNAPREKKRDGFFPLARVLRSRGKKAAPIPCVELPKGAPISVSCAGARDAATIELEGGGAVRLLGVAPPPVSSGGAAGRRAARRLRDRVMGRKVSLYPGPQSSEDRGTPQAYVVLNGVLLNAEMIQQGLARTADAPALHPYRETFDSLQRYAKNLGLGIWATDGP